MIPGTRQLLLLFVPPCVVVYDAPILYYATWYATSYAYCYVPTRASPRVVIIYHVRRIPGSRYKMCIVAGTAAAYQVSYIPFRYDTTGKIYQCMIVQNQESYRDGRAAG